LPFIW
jgi:Fe-S cluster biosynthesis and repair protein YggX